MKAFFFLLLAAFCLPGAAYAGGNDKELLQNARKAYLYRDDDTAIQALLPLAQDGNSEAMVLLSGIYRYKDPDLGFKYLQAAAAKKHPQALYGLGWAYLRGETPYKLGQDVGKALTLLEDASALGNADASSELADLYREGKAVAPSPKSAFGYALLEFNQKGSYSAARLARYYRDGIGVPVNLVKAFELLFINCYRHLDCDELEAIEPRLTKEQQRIAIASVPGTVRGQEDDWIVRPLELQGNWADADRSALLREYRQRSPLYALGQIKSMGEYAALNRPGLANALLLEITSVPAGASKPAGFNRNTALQRMTQRLAHIDQQKLMALNDVIATAGSLDSLVDKEMDDRQLRYLVALYQSSAATRVRAAIQTTHSFYADGTRNMWAKAFSAGVSLQGGSLSNYIAELLGTDKGKDTDRKRQIDVECSTNFYLLNGRIGKYHQSAFIASLAFLPMVLAEKRDTLVKFCVEGEYQFVDRVLKWKPVSQELEIAAKWRRGWESSQQNRKIEENYQSAVKQLIHEERARLGL